MYSVGIYKDLYGHKYSFSVTVRIIHENSVKSVDFFTTLCAFSKILTGILLLQSLVFCDSNPFTALYIYIVLSTGKL